MPVFTRPIHEHNDCHDPQTGEFCSTPGARVDPYKDLAFLKLSNKALRAFPSSPRQRQIQDQLRQRARELGAHWWADQYK